MSEVELPNFPTELEEPLRLSDIAGKAADAQTAIRQKGFDMWVGFEGDDLPQLRRIVGQTAMRTHSWDYGIEKSLESPEAAAQWLGEGDEELGFRGRALFQLVKLYEYDIDKRLAGFCVTWPEAPRIPTDLEPAAEAKLATELQDRNATFSLQMNELYPDEKLAASFTLVSLIHSRLYYHADGFWLRNWQANEAAARTFGMAGWIRQNVEVPSLRIEPDGSEVPDFHDFYTIANSKLTYENTQGPPRPARAQALSA